MSAPGSPLPWAVYERERGPRITDPQAASFIHAGPDVSDDTGFSLVARVYTRDGFEERQQNAAYIVEACNAYPALREQAEALAKALETVLYGVPRKVGKAWFPDGRPSKHDQCEHGVWMYEPCENCTDAFCDEALAAYRSAKP